jgi:hypothetical protein
VTYCQLRGDSRELACLSAALVVFHSSVPKESEINSIIVHSEKLKDSHPLEYGQTSIGSSVADFARRGSKKSVSPYVVWKEEPCKLWSDGVARPVTENLVSQRSTNFWRVLLWISSPKRTCSPTTCAPQKVESLKKMKKWFRCDPPKYGGLNDGNEKSPHTSKTIIEHPKKSLKVALLPLWFKDDL